MEEKKGTTEKGAFQAAVELLGLGEDFSDVNGFELVNKIIDDYEKEMYLCKNIEKEK